MREITLFVYTILKRYSQRTGVSHDNKIYVRFV